MGTVARIQKVLRCIEQRCGKDLSLDELAKNVNVSKSECLRRFKLTMQTTSYKFLMEYRLQQAAFLLRDTDLSVDIIADGVG